MKAHLEYLVREENRQGDVNDGVAIWCSQSAADHQRSYRDAVEEDYGVEQHFKINACSVALKHIFSRYPDVADIALMLIHFEWLAEREEDSARGERVVLAS